MTDGSQHLLNIRAVLAQFEPNSEPIVGASLPLAILLFIVVVNSPLRRRDIKQSEVSITTAWLGVILIAWWSAPVLRWLDVSAPNWRIATGLLLVAGAIVDLTGAKIEPVLFRPELGALALQTGRDHGVAAALLAGGIGLSTLVVWRRSSTAVGRSVSLVQIAAAAALVMDGVLAV